MTEPLNVPVEPLSQQRWSKIERSLFARLEAEQAAPVVVPVAARRLPVWVWLAAAAALGALVLVLAGGELRRPGEAVDRTSNITTGATPSHVALPGLSLDVQPESAVVVGGAPDRAMLIVVDRGSVVCDVAPRSSDAPLIVQAGAARVRVVGTRFSVTRSGESARVAVERGVVEVSLAGRTWRVTAGQAWSSAALTHSEQRRPESEALVPSARVEQPPPEVAQPPPEKAVPLRQRASAPQGNAAQHRFEEAAQLERSDPARAAALYGALAAGSGSWARNALFAQGRLEAARGNQAEARRLLEQYLARFPQGANADDARAVLSRLR